MVIHNRLVAMKLDTDKWTSVFEPVLSKYNISKHESIEMKLVDGNKESSKLLIWWNLHNEANQERLYPESKQGDEVRVTIKNNI